MSHKAKAETLKALELHLLMQIARREAALLEVKFIREDIRATKKVILVLKKAVSA